MRSSLILLVVVVVALGLGLTGLSTATGNNAKGPPHNFRFTQPFYNASVPENSLAQTIVLPYTEEELSTPKGLSLLPQKKMGVWNPSKLPVVYSIISGDSYKMFEASPLQIGDFTFLLLKVRNNDRILNREFKELYKLGVKAELLEEKTTGESFSKEKTETDSSPQALLLPTHFTTTEKMFIVSDLQPQSPAGESKGEDPFALQPAGKKGKSKRSKKSGESGESLSLSETRRRNKARRTLREERPFKSSASAGNRTFSGKPGERRKSGRRKKGRPGTGSAEILNEIKTDKEEKERTGSASSNANINVPINYKKSTTTTTSTTTRRPVNSNSNPISYSSKGEVRRKGVVISSAETVVYVRIIDVDDNQPVFESTRIDITVNEDAPVLSKVTKISAADADIGKNSEIYYSLVDWSETWTIDPITGVLSPTRPLLGKSKSERETIRVRARNRWNALPNSGSIASLNIQIKAVNRYAPKIRINRPPQIEVRPYGIIYAIVSVRDGDEGENGLVDLEIKEGDPNGIFSIRPTSSKNEFYVEMSPIIAQNLGKGDKSHSFNLTLKATDRGTPAKSDEEELQVRVADAMWSEKAAGAIFEKDVYEVEISETRPPHSVVFRLRRPDPAVGLSISSGNEGEDFLLEKSGVLYTKKWLDSESKSTYTLTIDSHDKRPSQRGDFYRRRQSVAKIIVKVVDGNDNSPVFDPLPNNRTVFTIQENESVGTKVARIVAKDRDSGENGYVTYSIANLKPVPFTIDHFTGDVRLAGLLDYEIDRREFNIKVRASDWGQPSRRQSERLITILLKDVNDNRPLFTVKECVALIERGIKFETEIGRIEAIDFDRNDPVTYRLIGGNEDGCFVLDPVTGRIKVVCDLRDVRVPKRFLNITATDGEYYSDVMAIKVELGDGRIPSLKLNRSAFSVSGENESANMVRSGIKLFSTSSSVFECEDTGVRERFDRMAALSEKNNQIEDENLGFPPLPKRYRDNMHVPQFEELPKDVSVFENATIGSSILTLRARDLDKGYNGLLTFVISSGDETHGAWDIIVPPVQPSADLTEAQLIVAAPLDREEVSQYILNISVWDQGKPAKVSSKLLYIKVKDSNDCPPTFLKSALKLKIPEGSELVGEQLASVTAYDEDEEGTPNSQVSYKLLSPSPLMSPFSIEEKTGLVRLTKELDREQRESYQLLIQAEDHGVPRLSSICVLTILVEDKNDNAPTFLPRANKNLNFPLISVLEDIPVGSVVTQILATDEDLGPGGNVRYAFLQAEEAFELDPLSGVIRVRKELDYETTSMYNLTIRAKDLGTPSLQSESFVVIEVLDVLESAPSITFTDLAIQASVAETAPVDSQIVKLGFLPKTAGESFATFSLEGETRYFFSIDQLGVVRTSHSLDYETHPSHWLTVLAKSQASGKILGKMDLFVNVTDSNECVPLTTEPSYRILIPENTPPSTLLLKLSAFDCDPGGPLTFTLKTPSPYFDLSPSGELVTSEIPLDREKEEVLVFDILVTDSGHPPLQSATQVTVFVLDENDNSPKFLHKRGILNIPEFNNELQSDQPLKKKGLLIQEESGESSESSENEILDDDEDETLKWSDWQQKLLQEEADTLGESGGWKKIFQVVAFDEDEGPNGTISYRLKYRVSADKGDNAGGPSGSDEAYSINPKTGEIYTSASSLKGESMLKFIIEAKDSGVPEKVSETILMLRVKPLNRQKSKPPQILLQDNSEVQLTTKESAGYSVETIDAEDPEGDPLWYEIVSGDPDQYFVMWPESQNLILARRIETQREFMLNISVSDGTNPSFVMLHVKVINSEQSSDLTWTQIEYSAVLNEQNSEFGIVSNPKINSTLSSKGEHFNAGMILYGFHNAQDSRSLQIFAIDTITGEVTVAKGAVIDRETLARHVLTIKARNPANLYGFVRLVIEVEEWNDHAPVFYTGEGRYPVMEFRVPETLAVGSHIVQVQAFDLDEGESGQLSYSITFGNIGNTFTIDKAAGWLTLQRPLRSQTEYSLTVQATDSGTPPLSSTTTVSIIPVLPNDEEVLSLDCRGDDYYPQGQGRLQGQRGKTVMRVRVKENSPAGTYVTTISPLNSNSASVSFELEDNRLGAFWVDPATGVLLVGKGRGLLDRESKGSHEVTVKATNTRGSTANCRIVIDLLDENDHRPVFTSTYYEGLIREDAMPGTLVRKKEKAEEAAFSSEKKPLVLESKDLDVGLNALSTYSIIEEEEMRKVFHIDPSTGALLLVTSLDFEKRSNYVFHVKATDGGGLSSPNVATVNVTVENVNMKRPIVTNARVELLLPTGPGLLVHKVQARDPDGDELEYNITKGNEAGIFKIGKKSGEIRILRAGPDFSLEKVVLDVSVGDGKHWTLGSISVIPRSLERNPNFYFKNSTFSTSTMENSTKIANLLSLPVIGAYMNEPLLFQLLSPTPYFGIKATSGVIFTTGEKLDREEKAEHVLLVQVRGEDPTRLARSFVKISILDKNDECPVFLNLPYVAVISLESGAGDGVIQVRAFDGDEGENALIKYELVRSPHGDIYDLDRNSGHVRLRRKPDSVGSHELTIKAYDGGLPTCTSEALVVVKVVSSDQPVFEQQFYETWIPEDAALQSTAIALMAHAHNPVLYSIHGGNEQDEFAIDYQTGVLYVNSPLDFEAQQTHRLTVRATDLVTSSGSSTQVLIHIRDSNDARPVFDKPIHTIRLVEGYMPPASLLLSLKAHDNDTGINALLTYELVSDDGPILRLPPTSINPNNNNNNNPRRNRRMAQIETQDVTEDHDHNVMEDATSNQADKASRYFMVKPNEGKILLKQMVDYEQGHEYRFSVIVKDSGIPQLSSTARVVVQVVDINDSGVVLEKNLYQAKISESVPLGHVVAKISAYDPDSVDFVKYSIIGHSYHQSPFDIDAGTGVVRVSQPNLLLTELNFELNISVTDGVFTSFAKLNVEVEPRNHHAPAFSSRIYEVACPENAPEGHLIATLRAVDPDRSIFGKVSYSIAQTDEPGLFEIHEQTGEVRLKSGIDSDSDIGLDREIKGSHTLEIMAEDGGGWIGFTKLAVKVMDTNEYPPQFPVTEYRVTVPADRIRSKTPILQVVAVDADTEFGIRYSIVDLPSNRTADATKRDSSYFEINPESGEVRLRLSDQEVVKFLKEKSRQDFQFWAGATDEGGLHSHIPVTVVLLPEGIPSPELSPQNATFFVKEDSAIGSIVTTFRVANIEAPRFRVMSNNEEYFQVDKDGNLLVKARLDQENEDKHTVVIWAHSEDGSSVATSQVTIRVFQSTGRKRPPVFQSQEYRLKVAEDFPEGSLLFTVRALDSDKSNNIKEKYSLVQSKNGYESNLFSINQEHGWITLVNRLDYEVRREHVLRVTAADVDKPYLQTTATVTLSVINIPDCPVSFDSPHYFSSVREDVPEGTIIATVHATDLDQAATGKGESSHTIVSNYLSYSILDGNKGGHFKINERGELSIWRGLDYEVEQKYELKILATDGFYSDFANVTVTLLDVNDNSPICPLPEYEVELSESVQVGTYVITVEARDPDLSALPPRFSLQGEGAKDFEIEGESGAITVRNRLDRETKAFYSLLAYAEDAESGEACRSEVRVKVTDENDNPPRFSESLYTVTVKEDAPVGALIGKVHADDADMGQNRRLRYSLLSVTSGTKDGLITDQFSLDPNSGVISLLRPLDRELVPGYNLTVQATDAGMPPLSTLVDMRVIVIDVNDNPPEFAFNYYSATISELAPLSSEVTRVLATSKDIGVNAEITYDIVGGNGYNHFGIHPKTGVIFVSAPLDYERIREYVLAIRGRDGGSPPLASQALVNISLIDQNDNAPQWSSGGSGYSVQIPEDAVVGATVIQIQAADLDSGINSQLTYQIGSGDRMRHFKIDGYSGMISVASNLDREMIHQYSLEVWAVDQGVPPLSSSTTVEIQVLDFNDNPPLLRVPDSEIIVQEDKPLGYQIHKFDVSDADSPPNAGPFSWDLRDTEGAGRKVPFTIGEGGTLNVAGKLNSQRKPLYKLQVRVFDNGDPPLYSDANITVKVVDKSQWPPVVSTLTVTAITPDETYPAGIPLGKVHASDFDPYDVLVYSLVETPSSTHFLIDPSNGTLKSLTPLKAGTYELGVTVSDGRWTARGDAYIRIVTLASLIPDMKFTEDMGVGEKEWNSGTLKKSRKDISLFAVVMTFKGHTPQSLLTRIFALISSVKEAMGLESSGVSIYDVVILSVQNSKPDYQRERLKREASASASSEMSNDESSANIPSVDVLLSVRKSTDGSFVPPSELLKKLKFALPQIESVLSSKVTRLTYDVCRENSCDRGQCRTVATFEGTQSLTSTETLSLITPTHSLETVCFCPPGFGGPKCEKVINACAHSDCLAGSVCVPDASPKGYACLCRKIYCPPGLPCTEDDHCAQQSVSFSGHSFLAYNVGPSLERELSLTLKIRTVYTGGTIMHSFGHFDYALLEIRQGLVQFSFDLGTGKEVLTVTSVSVSDNRWHRITLHLRDNHAILRVDERSTLKQKSPGPARSLHAGGILYLGAKIIGVHGSTLESLIPSQGFVGCMKDLRYGYLHANGNGGSSSSGSGDLNTQEVKHYITPGISRLDLDSLDPNKGLSPDEMEDVDEDLTYEHSEKGKAEKMVPLPLHSSDSDRLGSHLLWSRNISFSCERIPNVAEACRSQPCMNGGVCSEDRSGSPAGSVSNYKCDCPSRFHGVNCEIDLDPCGSLPCLNGGTCMPNASPGVPGVGVSFSPSLMSVREWTEPQSFCQCPEGTYGLRCERGRWCKVTSDSDSGITDTFGNPLTVDGGEICKNQGECEDGPSGPICWCLGGYTGATCQLDINECERGDACGPGSICTNYPGGFRCTCPANATGSRCNRALATPSIVVSDYQDLILIVVFIVLMLFIVIGSLIFVRRCCIARERNQMSNSIPLTSARGLKDGHAKDNRERDSQNREAQHLLRNRDSKISNLEVRPVSASSDLFTQELDEAKPTFINNLMKGPTKDKGVSTHWDPNRDDYDNKAHNYMKGDLNWASRSKPGSPTSELYHWDHSDLNQPNISPNNTLPPPPSDLPDTLRVPRGPGSSHSPNSSSTTNASDSQQKISINLAALPPPDEPMALPYFDHLDLEGTSLDLETDPKEKGQGPRNWDILHPNQYLLPLPHEGEGEASSAPDTDLCSCPQLLEHSTNGHPAIDQQKPVAIRNRYTDKKGTGKKKKVQIAEEPKIDESSSLLSGSSSSRSNNPKSKIPRRQCHTPSKGSSSVTQV